MFAIRQRRKTVSEKDFLDAITKVIKGYQKFSSTAKYMVGFVIIAFSSCFQIRVYMRDRLTFTLVFLS